MRLGGLVAYAVDKDLEHGSSVGGRLVGPDPRGDDCDEGSIDPHELKRERDGEREPRRRELSGQLDATAGVPEPLRPELLDLEAAKLHRGLVLCSGRLGPDPERLDAPPETLVIEQLEDGIGVQAPRRTLRRPEPSRVSRRRRREPPRPEYQRRRVAAV